MQHDQSHDREPGPHQRECIEAPEADYHSADYCPTADCKVECGCLQGCDSCTLVGARDSHHPRLEQDGDDSECHRLNKCNGLSADRSPMLPPVETARRERPDDDGNVERGGRKAVGDSPPGGDSNESRKALAEEHAGMAATGSPATSPIHATE